MSRTRHHGTIPTMLILLALSASCGKSTAGPSGPVPVDKVTVTPAGPVSLPVGATRQLVALATSSAGATLSGKTFIWSSSDQAVAMVGSDGLVTALSPGGPVSMTATSEGKSASVVVTVTPPAIATIMVTPPTSLLAVNGTVALTATARSTAGTLLTGRSITWASSATAIASVGVNGLVTAGTVGGTVTISATSEGVTGTASITVALPSFNTAWMWRQRVTVSAGTASVPADYSVAVPVNHAAMVGAGRALASGNDLRVAHWTGTQWVELDRVLDKGSVWNSGATTIWFKTQAAINANTSDMTYYVYYGNPVAAAAPANAGNVFLFVEDFESGTLDKWLVSGGSLWNINHTRAHGGTASVSYPAQGAAGSNIIAKALDVADVYVDAWWNINGSSTLWNVAQGLRQASGASNRYYSLLCLCLGPSVGWNIARYHNGVYTDIASPGGNPVPNSWMRIGTAMAGTTYRVFVNGAAVREAASLTELTSGSIGFYKYVVPAGLQIWIDDVIARRYVFPEPTAVAGTEEAAP